MSPEVARPREPVHGETPGAGKQAKADWRFFMAFEFLGLQAFEPRRQQHKLKEEAMRRTFRRLLPALMAGLFLAAPSIIARGQGANPPGPASKKIKGLHREEVKAQRRRLKQTRKSTRAEARSAVHSKAPKAVRHPVRKVRRNANPNNPALRQARQQSRSRKKSHPKPPAN